MNNFRKLTDYEANILEKLFSREFPGRDALRTQISTCLVRTIEEYKDNYGSLEFQIDSDVKASVTNRIPVFGQTKDSDGILIEIFLHVIDGKVDELEIVKADNSPANSPIKQKINPSTIEVTTDQEVIHQ